MPARQDQTLQIFLIVFIFLFLVSAVLAYLGWKGYGEAEQRATANETSAIAGTVTGCAWRNATQSAAGSSAMAIIRSAWKARQGIRWVGSSQLALIASTHSSHQGSTGRRRSRVNRSERRPAVVLGLCGSLMSVVGGLVRPGRNAGVASQKEKAPVQGP